MTFHPSHLALSTLAHWTDRERAAIIGRMYHTLCVGGSRELRGEVRLSGERLVELDINSAFPVMLQVMMPGAEREVYRDLLASGDIYSELGVGIERTEAKVQMMKLYAGYIYPHMTLHKEFGRRFPEATNLITRMRHGGETLAAKLQNLEAEVTIKGVGVWTAERSLPFVPIHDGLLCLPGDVESFRVSLMENFERVVGVSCVVEGKG